MRGSARAAPDADARSVQERMRDERLETAELLGLETATVLSRERRLKRWLGLDIGVSYTDPDSGSSG